MSSDSERSPVRYVRNRSSGAACSLYSRSKASGLVIRAPGAGPAPRRALRAPSTPWARRWRTSSCCRGDRVERGEPDGLVRRRARVHAGHRLHRRKADQQLPVLRVAPHRVVEVPVAAVKLPPARRSDRGSRRAPGGGSACRWPTRATEIAVLQSSSRKANVPVSMRCCETRSVAGMNASATQHTPKIARSGGPGGSAGARRRLRPSARPPRANTETSPRASPSPSRSRRGSPRRASPRTPQRRAIARGRA